MFRRLLLVAIVLLARVPAASAQYRFEVVHAFDGTGPGGRVPSAPLLETSDGSLYGTTLTGGAGDAGVIFRLLPDRSVVTTDLQSKTTAKTPYAGLVQAPDGTLYGTASAGGATGSGAFFAIAPSGSFVTYDLPGTRFCDGRDWPALGPRAPLVLAPDGTLYGPVPAPIFGSPCFYYTGSLMRLTPGAGLTKIAPIGAVEEALVFGPSGYLYGTGTTFGSGEAYAWVFDLAVKQSAVVHRFDFDRGERGAHAFVVAPDGNLYSTLESGGTAGKGTVFRMSPSGLVTMLHDFQSGSDGANPRAGLVLSRDGNLYGVTARGGASDLGTIFRISLAGDYSVIYTFTGAADGATPVASLIEGRDGSLYGTASAGGPAAGGVVFRIKNVASQPVLSLDTPVAGRIHLPLEIGGWAIDRGAWSDTGIDAVHVYAFPTSGQGGPPIFLGAAPLGFARPDIAAVYGPQFANAGWLMRVDSLPGGRYQIVAYGHSSVTNSFSVSATRDIELDSRPVLSLDSPAPGAVLAVGARVFVGGWAIDRGATVGSGMDAVHVWIYPNGGAGTPFFAGVATYGVSRSDVGAAFGSQFTASGYELDVNGLAPGNYIVAVFAHSTVTNSFVIMQTRAVTISP